MFIIICHYNEYMYLCFLCVHMLRLNLKFLVQRIILILLYIIFFEGSDFVTMIQIDCAVTDTKTLHIRDIHLKHSNDFKNNVSSNLKQQHGINFY